MNLRVFSQFKQVFSLCGLVLAIGLLACISVGVVAQSKEPAVIVHVNAADGSYAVQDVSRNWTFVGSVGHPLAHVEKTRGRGEAGAFSEIRFSWKADHSYQGSIRWYRRSPVVIFSLTIPQKADSISVQFPSFSQFPRLKYHYSFRDAVFSPPSFRLNKTSTPWLFFDGNDDAFIVSPASDFMVSKMTGDGINNITSGLNTELRELPAGFTHRTILAFDHGIHQVWTDWGNALTGMYKKEKPANDADTVLKYFGYWTDNGADYYYDYDTTLGYAGTLLKLRRHYQKEGIPLGYMQLDSWWYEKSIYDPNGKPDAGHKNKNLPSGEWNRYGGLLFYTADKFLFPKGLAAFNRNLGLPMVTHNRWVDPKSPYVSRFKISGYAAVDPAFWHEIIGYVHHSGVICYEQDWLNFIYSKSPEMESDLSVGNAFTDGMANACRAYGLDMQYCMAMPRYFMQGLKYGNLTTIRTSGDRFEPAKWHDFIYTAQLANAMGIWPWSDVFMSHETCNMIVSVLSAGPVGTGDRFGHEDKANIMEAARVDGILVKPDASLVPMDGDYIREAGHIQRPMLAFTYTRQNNVRTNYVLVFASPKTIDYRYEFRPSDVDLGMTGQVVVYDPLTGDLRKMAADSTFTGTLGNGSITEPMEKTGNTRGGRYRYSYYILAPVTPIGIAFLGDEGKITATGRQRIPELSSTKDHLRVRVAFAKGEPAVTLHGYYDKKFKTDRGVLQLDSRNNTFTLSVSAPESGGDVTINFSAR
jgi:hypothetical protein